MRSKKNRFKLPVFMMIAVIFSGLVIGGLAIYFVSQQKKVREFNLKRDYSDRVEKARRRIEAKAVELIEKVFRDVSPENLELGSAANLLGSVKEILLSYPMVKYPFFLSRAGTRKTYLFPFTERKLFNLTGIRSGEALTGEQEKILTKGENLEYKEKRYAAAIRYYFRLLERGDKQAPAVMGRAGEKLRPYLLNAAARCYFKLKMYPQAVSYYKRVLSEYPHIVEKDKSLYFTLLRQLASAYRSLRDKKGALKVYLDLYEGILKYEYSEQGNTGRFAFLKNEALDYLNRGDPVDSPEKKRFSRAREIDRLEDASGIDIALRWSYFETEMLDEVPGPGIENEDELQLLKLKEFYAAGDEKMLFYRHVKEAADWGGELGSGIKIKERPYLTVSKKIAGNHVRYGDIIFGFQISLDYFRRQVAPAIAGEEVRDGFLKLAITGGKEVTGALSRQYVLHSVPFGKIFTGNKLSLLSQREDYIEEYVQREMGLYWGLIIILITVLISGIYLYYRYISREAVIVRQKSDFLDRISHTIKSPLTRMSLLAENVQQGWVKDEAKKKEFLDTIVSEILRMNEMVDNLLNFSRIEAGKRHYAPERISLQGHIRGIVEEQTLYLKDAGFVLELEIDDTLPPVLFDVGAIKLIIVNLLQNAVKYSEKDKFIAVRYFREKDRAVLQVEDRGIGIAEKELPMIFKKFIRSGDTKVRAREGSGLGLFLVHHAVTAHGGEIKVKSEPNKGTIFAIYLPPAALRGVAF